MMRSMTMAAALVASAATMSQADTVLEMDINTITVTAVPDAGPFVGFSESFSGTLTLSANSNSFLGGIEINDLQQTVLGSLASLSGSISLLNGSVTGGSFSVAAYDVGNAGSTGTYTATIVDGVGDIDEESDFSGTYWTIDGLTFAGMFSGLTFAGVDVSAFFGAQPLMGSFFNFDFRPGVNGSDTSSDLELAAIIPLPQTAALAVGPLLGLGVIRRRRTA